MSKELSLVVVVNIKPEHKEHVKKSMMSLLLPTRKEEGCILYDLHEDRENTNTFIFYEIWESEEYLAKHLQSEHVLTHRKNIDGMIEDSTFHRLNRIII